MESNSDESIRDTSGLDTVSLDRAMRSLHDETEFPVLCKDFSNIGSTFTYRFLVRSGRPDFHRALDISEENAKVGDIIVAAYSGVFINYDCSGSGGCVLTLRHKFPQKFNFKGKKIEYFYTIYSHLNDKKTRQIIDGWQTEKPVFAKQPIAVMGKSGRTNTVHLHLSLRIGTQYSLQRQERNPPVEKWGFDPQIHPMMLFPALEEEQVSVPPTLSFLENNNESVKFLYECDRTQPILNRLETRIIGNDGILASHIIDLNLRTGLVPKAIEGQPGSEWFDYRDLSKPHFKPKGFGYQLDRNYKTEIVVPKSWIDSMSNRGDAIRIEVEIRDIWGKPVDFALML